MAETKINLKVCTVFQTLNLQHQKFVLEYLKSFNATKAARKAKYSAKTARTQGSFLLTKPDILKAIEEVKAQLSQGDIASVQEIAEYLTRIKRGNINKVATWTKDGLFFTASSDEMDNETAELIKKVKVTEKTSQKGDWTECKTEVELHDPVKAAELLGRYHGMFKDKVEHSGTIEVKHEADKEFLEWLRARK